MSGLETKYEVWGKYLKKRRLELFRSARDFCSKQEVGISYPQYSRYEAGDQLPSLDQAIRIFRLLNTPLLEGVLNWCLAQSSDSEVQNKLVELLSQLNNQGDAISTSSEVKKAEPQPESNLSRVSFDKTIVFNRSHLDLFQSDPLYRDVFTYLNSYSSQKVTVPELAEQMAASNEKVSRILSELSKLGVVVETDGQYQVSKATFYFPDDQDFFELRNQNLKHNVSQILNRLNFEDLKEKKSYRGLITRELNESQLSKVIEKCEQVLGEMWGFDDSSHQASPVYSLCLLLGERFDKARNTVLPQGLSQGVQSTEAQKKENA